jgi:transcriptional regulator with XRE-family HTH domain
MRRDTRGKTHHAKREALDFRVLLMRIAKSHGWNRDALAGKLGVSKRTTSHWICGHWLPPARERVHVLLTLRDEPSDVVLALADALGLSTDPAAAPVVRFFEDRLEAEEAAAQAIAAPPAAAPAPPPPPKPRPTPEALRAAADGAIREAADAMDARPNELRIAVGQVLAALAALDATIDDARGALAVTTAGRGARKEK